MNVKAFGTPRRGTLILLHGGGLSWWNYREEAALLAADYRVLLPSLDGHAGSDRPFTTIEDCAAELIAWIDGELGGRVELIGGLSLGAQVLVELLSRRPGLCRAALVESASLIPDRLTHALIAPSLASSYGLIRNERFARLQFRSLHMREELFDDYYRDSCALTREDMTRFLEASTAYALRDTVASCGAAVSIYVGERESRAMRRSAALLHEKLPGSGLTVLPGLYHGEFSLNRPADYAKAVRALLD